MIDVQEHFYDDDPAKGHADVRTRLKGVSYFFLGNGLIQAAVQVAPEGEGTPMGLLIMNPERLGKKREALSFDKDGGLERTMVRIAFGNVVYSPESQTVEAGWHEQFGVPVVFVRWQGKGFSVTEHFYCPRQTTATLIREVRVRNETGQPTGARLETGIQDRMLDLDLAIPPGGESKVILRYTLDGSTGHVVLDEVRSGGVSKSAARYWRGLSEASFGSPLLDHYFNASRVQLLAAISRSGVADGSIWQYNHEWVRDQAMMVQGLILSGHHDLARTMLDRLFSEFVTEEGDAVDSSVKREYDEVELDQGGMLIHALRNYVMWTGDLEIVRRNWAKIEAAAEFPLKPVFRHEPSGLMANSREFWERHRLHGIEKGMELSYQLFTSIGLSSGAELALLLSEDRKASFWQGEAERIKRAMLNDTKYGLVHNGRFIKRRDVDGRVQETISASAEAQLPIGVPLAGAGPHYLNPESSVVLPIVMGAIAPDSPIAAATLADIETLWNQDWDGGGYGRYHFSSEPDSPGGWPFASLFVARAYVETGDFDKVWRVLRWLETIAGSRAGSWFEFYGPRLAPPFPQVGITPWTWGEMLLLLAHHIMGIRPQTDHLYLRPRFLPETDVIRASFPLRGSRLTVDIKRAADGAPARFRSDGTILESTETEAKIAYPEGDLTVEAILSPE